MLLRQYAIKYLNVHEIKSLLVYFGCNLNENVSLGKFIRELRYNARIPDETTNKNIQMLKNLQYTNPNLLNKKICAIKWN